MGVDSTLGQGSAFWLTARLGKCRENLGGESGAFAEEAEKIILRECAGTRILLAEDDPVNREVALDLLRGAGLEVDGAGNGRVALRLAEENEYSLILMDVQMPEMDGQSASRAIRALPGRATVPIIAMTANAFAEDRRACLAAGMTDFVAKPLEPDRLFATLVRYFVRPVTPA